MEIQSSLTRDIMDTIIILWGFPDSRLSQQYFQEKISEEFKGNN